MTKLVNPRLHGRPPYIVAVIHGGPGAAGDLNLLAHILSNKYGVIEPLQTKDTIQQQISELDALISAFAENPITLLGHSWGAWLSLLYTTYHSMNIKKLILVSSGPFTKNYAQQISKTRIHRLTTQEKIQLNTLENALTTDYSAIKEQFFIKLANLMKKTDSYELIHHQNTHIIFNYHIHKTIWSEAEQLRQQGELINNLHKIRCPVIAIHGDYDPHPYQSIKETLSSNITDFKFILLKNCGHYPWYEKHARHEFFEILDHELPE